MAAINSYFNQDLSKPVKVHYLDGNVFSADNQGNVINVELFNNGDPVAITESVSASIIRADGATVPVIGSASGNTASVTIPQAAYAIPGPISIIVKLVSGSIVTTICAIVAVVYMASTDAVVDPGTIIPSIETLLSAINSAVASIPADWEGLNFSLQLTGERSESNIPSGMYNVTGKILKADGTLDDFSGWNTTPYIPILDRDMYFKGGFFPSSAYNTFCLYDASFGLVAGIKNNTLVKASDYPTAMYFRASEDSSHVYFVTIGTQRSFDWILRTITAFTAVDPVMLSQDYYYEQGILSSDGLSVDDSFASAHDYNTTPYVEIVGKDLYFSGGFFPSVAYNSFVLYDASKNVVAMGRGTQTIRLADYPSAKYFRASSNYRATGDIYVMISNGENQTGRTIHIGSGYHYTTLRAGIAEAIKTPNTKVIVHPGTYDLTVEFADIISAQPSGLQGLYLSNNVYVEFMAGSYVKALFPTSNSWINTYFNPFYGRDFVLDGLNIEASNCRYCIHDEQSGDNVQYHNVYKNCVMKMTANGATGTYCQCIGGGLGKNGYIEVIGGRYSSYGSDGSGESPAISYHNGGYAGMDSKLFFSDVYLDGDGGFFRFGWYGPSTKKSEVYVSNCSMKAPILERAENSSGTVDNFEVIEWNNTIRN